MTFKLALAVLALSSTPALAHRLDEYLQAAIVSVEKTRTHVELSLTPGVAVFPSLISGIDTNGDGVVSGEEQRAYAARVLRDLSVAIDGNPLTLQLASMQFPAIEEMKEGQGEIQLDFDADLPRGGRTRKLTIENHHLGRIAAYQVNCLVPRDPDIRIAAQTRNYSQSVYELTYEDMSVPSATSFLRRWSASLLWLSPFALLLLTFHFRDRLRNA
jgi:hypothetical protein